MPNIQITVRGKTAQPEGAPVIVCGNSDYTVTFAFDSEWLRYAAKTARFCFVQNGVRRYYDVLFEGDTVSVPVLSDVYAVEIGVYAGDIHTSTPARIPCARSVTDGAPQHADPPADVYDQLLAYLAALQNGSNAAVTAVPLANLADGGTVVTTEGEE